MEACVLQSAHPGRSAMEEDMSVALLADLQAKQGAETAALERIMITEVLTFVNLLFILNETSECFVQKS